MHPFLYGTVITVLYFVTFATIMLTIRYFFNIPDEIFRKILHFILLGAYIPLVFAFKARWLATAFALLLIIILHPLLFAAEKISGFSSFVNERKEGEFKSSMVLAVGMMAFSVAVCWGIFKDKYLVLASIYAWGVGDAAAALIGKRFGKHKITWKAADGKKSVEGSFAFFVCSFLSVMAVLLVRGKIDILWCVIISAVTAALCAVAEMCSKNGIDTVICPIVAMFVLIPSIMFFSR